MTSRLSAALPLLVLALLVALGGDDARAQTRAGALGGVVHDAGGAPLAGATVTVTAPDGTVVGRTETDAGGAFDIPVPSPEGDYRLHIAAAGHADFETELPVAPGERQSLAVTLLSREIAQRNEAVGEYNAGVEALGGDDPETASVHFAAAVAADPGLELAYLGWAESLHRAGRHAEAKTAVETYRGLAPTDTRGLRLAYDIYQALGDEVALAELRPLLTATEAAPAVAADLYNQGVAAHHAGDSATAMERFRAATEADPGLLAAWEALATVHYDREEYADARAAVERLLAVDPDSLRGLRVRFLILDAEGDPGAGAALEALAAVDAAAAAQLLYQRADLDFRAGDSAAARAALTRVLELAPEMPRAHYTLGLVHASGGDLEAARRHLQRFLELAPDDPEAESAREILAAL